MNSPIKFLRRVRIHGRECGAVARALRHKIEANPLSAADKKVLSTTNERKVMSKTTFFKRIALTAIAALGFGMLSVAPSQAIAGAPTITVAAGSGSVDQPTTGASETGTAATFTITGILDALTDKYAVTVFRKSAPDSALVASLFKVILMDTSTYTNTVIDSAPATANSGVQANGADVTASYESTTIGTATDIHGAAAGYVGARFGIIIDSGTARTGSHGDYVFTVSVTPLTSGTTAGTVVTADVTYSLNRTAAVIAAASTTVDPSKTKAVLNAGTNTETTTADAAVSVVATSGNTTHATIQVNTYNAAGSEAAESITVTLTGPGLVGDGSVFGKSLTLAGDGSTSIQVRADGTAGTASIVVATTTVTFPAKNVTFYATVPSTVVASVNKPVISVGTNTDVVRATFKDASGNIWGGAAYIYAATAADALIAGSLTTPVACTFSSASQRHSCDISGATKGTASFKVIDGAGAGTTAATAVAAAVLTSDALSVRVSTGVASSVVLSFDKATYAPGEKAQLRVSVLDGEGLSMPGVTITNALAAGGITTASAFGTGSDTTTTAVSFDLSGSTSAVTNTNAGHKTYVVYMPATAGAVTVSATGGTGIAAAGRVAVTASAIVVDTSNDASIAAAEAASDAAAEAIDAANAATDAANLAAEAADAATVAAEEARDAADAATAAVEALATEVATLMAALKAQITTLANTVAKIAKKVKA